MRAPVLLLAAASCGCWSASGPAPHVPPPLTIRVAHWYGTPLGGPTELPEREFFPAPAAEGPTETRVDPDLDAQPEAPPPPTGPAPAVGPAAVAGEALETPPTAGQDDAPIEPSAEAAPDPAPEAPAAAPGDAPAEPAPDPAPEAPAETPGDAPAGPPAEPAADAAPEAPAATPGDAPVEPSAEPAPDPEPEAPAPAPGDAPVEPLAEPAPDPAPEAPAPAPVDVPGPWAVEVEVCWIDAPHREVVERLELTPLAPDATLVTSIGGGVPVLVSAPHVERSRVVPLESADELDRRLDAAGEVHVRLAELVGLAVDGFSLAVELGPPDGDPDRPQLAVELGRAGGRTELALVAVGGNDVPEPPDSTAPEDLARYEEQLALLDVEQRALLTGAPDLAAPHAALLLPSPFDGGRTTLAVRLGLTPAAPATVERLGAAVVGQAARAAEQTTPPADAGRRAALVQGLALLGGERAREALGLLAEETGAALTGDLALVAEPELVNALAARAGALVAELPRDAGEAAGLVAWSLRRSALELLLERARAGTLHPALESVLLRHVGELGRLPSLLGDVLAAADSPADLDRRLLAENRLLLEDPDPSARRRAHRWLAERGAAPVGYDPLAPADERRAALLAASGTATESPR